MLISHLLFCLRPTTASAGRNSSIHGLRLLAVAEVAIDFRFQVVQETDRRLQSAGSRRVAKLTTHIRFSVSLLGMNEIGKL